MPQPTNDDVAHVARLPSAPMIREVVLRTTSMRFAAGARVTEAGWTACVVRDEIAVGLEPDRELVLKSTLMG